MDKKNSFMHEALANAEKARAKLLENNLLQPYRANNMDYKALKKEIPYKWKIQSFNYDKTKASCVAYIDARDVMDLLDDVVGAEKRHDEYKMVGDRIMCGLTINGVTKRDTGSESATEAEKGQVSDAFKRAGVKWGIGRFLYSKDIVRVNVKDKKPVDEQGQRIYDLTKYCNDKQGKPTQKEKPQANQADDDKPWFNDKDFDNMKTAIMSGKYSPPESPQELAKEIRKKYKLSKANASKLEELYK